MLLHGVFSEAVAAWLVASALSDSYRRCVPHLLTLLGYACVGVWCLTSPSSTPGPLWWVLPAIVFISYAVAWHYRWGIGGADVKHAPLIVLMGSRMSVYAGVLGWLLPCLITGIWGVVLWGIQRSSLSSCRRLCVRYPLHTTTIPHCVAFAIAGMVLLAMSR